MWPFSVSRKSEFILHQSCLMMTECVYACLCQELIKEFYFFTFLKRKMIESNRVICGLCVAKSLRLKLSYFWLLLFTYTFLILYIREISDDANWIAKKGEWKRYMCMWRKGNKWKIQNQIYFEDTMATYTYTFVSHISHI